MSQIQPIGDRQIIRLCESGSAVRHDLDPKQRTSVEDTVAKWCAENPSEDRPLVFTGAHGEQLSAQRFAGVIGAHSVTVEVFPKLDAALLRENADVTSAHTNAALQNLLWMMEVADNTEATGTGNAGLQDAPTNFFDVYAFLMAKTLKRELEIGVPHDYVGQEDDLRMVRGRLNLAHQITRNWNRWDRLNCRWDGFTPDNALMRLFKCSCRFLLHRVACPRAAQLLEDCVGLLEEAGDTDIRTALEGVRNVRWDRRLERFRTTFALAHRLLRGTSPTLSTGETDTFVFLVDMHQLFDDYVHAVIERAVATTVERQVTVGTLFASGARRMSQIADYRWQASTDVIWIGDAKYKHLGSDRQPFEKLAEADVRQVTVYAELERLRLRSDYPPSLMILFPFVGSDEEFTAHQATAWNGADFWLVPVDVRQKESLAECIPADVTALSHPAE